MSDAQEPAHTRPVAEVPSALERFDALQAFLDGRTPALFLDYDGTLTPIVERPELAVLSKSARRAVDAVARKLPVAIISGRDRVDVARLVGIDSLTVAGSHGFDIRVAGGGEVKHEVGGDMSPLLDAVEAELHRRLDGVPGALVERKKYSIAAHYRLVAPERAHEVREAVDAILAAHPELKVKPGKMVFEIQPNIDWHKGKAVLWLLQALKLDRDDIIPVFIGDDITDEDAFRSLQGRGLGVVVAHPGESRPTAADFRVDDPDGVIELLQRLAP